MKSGSLIGLGGCGLKSRKSFLNKVAIFSSNLVHPHQFRCVTKELLAYLSYITYPGEGLFAYFHGSYCDTKKSCCYPTTGKPVADFGIHGLWPNYNDGSYPTNCDPDSPFDASAITDLKARMQRDWPTLACPSSDGIKFWSHEWEKHGTCTVLDEHAYFEKALMLKKQIDLLTILRNAGITPDDSFYSLNSISNAIAEATGFTPVITCNRDEARNNQLYEIYMCVDTSASKFIECPVIPRNRCSSRIEFPSFSSGGEFSAI